MDTVVSKNRASALDALRGYAILTMVLSGTIADTLPKWMYHAQVPPPDHIFTPTIFGITWVDLVFPFFLFAMGAAFPFSIGKKLGEGISKGRVSLDCILRGLQLAFFAIFLQHIYPFSLSDPQDYRAWFTTLGGFVLLFPMFMRLPWKMNQWLRVAIKLGAYIFAFIMLLTIRYAHDRTFSLDYSNIIILVLANMAIFGSLAYIFTYKSKIARVAVLPFVMTILLCMSADFSGSWQKALFDFTPFPWLYKFYYLKYLFIVIPGSIAGEYLMEWINDKKTQSVQLPENKNGLAILLSFLTFVIIVLNLYGLFTRHLIFNLLGTIILLSIGIGILYKTSSDFSKLWKKLFFSGSYLLMLGLFFEAFEGGIRKDTSTFSYYFVTSGLACMALIFFSIICDYFKCKKSTAFLTMSGQNPMIAYVGSSVVVQPILHIIGLWQYVNRLSQGNSWEGLLQGIILTGLVTLMTMFFTKIKWFWRT